LFLKPFPSKINSTGTFFSGERAWWCGVVCGVVHGAGGPCSTFCFEWAGAVVLRVGRRGFGVAEI
jgi:hypothetical protein